MADTDVCAAGTVDPVALGVALRHPDERTRGDDATTDELLVSRLGPFPEDDEAVFFRPPGGGVEFGETTTEAVVREFDEELDATVRIEGFAGVVENRFAFAGEHHHEHCFVYLVAFADDARYEMASMHGVEDDGDVTYETEWATLDDLEPREEPLYPEGFRALLETDKRRIAAPRE
jgi:ADP-ribose pyrophosphatase YjhB (NUDIX family)